MPNNNKAQKIIHQLINNQHLPSQEKQRLQQHFWNHLNTTPLIAENKDGTYNITFIYQSNEKANIKLDSLDLIELLIDENGKERLFTQIPETDIYYLELNHIPANTLIPYEFEVNGGKSTQDFKNPHVFNMRLYNTEKKETALNTARTSSLLTLPQSISQPWNQPHPAKNQGVIKKWNPEHTHNECFSDKNFGERPLWLYTPPNFDEAREKPYQLMLILDGHAYIDKLPPTFDALSQTNPDLSNIVIAIIGNVNPHSVPHREINPQ